MIRPLVHDPLLLARPSLPADESDLAAAQDLLDTLMAHREACVGMAANMIGVWKRFIVVQDGEKYLTLFNPEITEKSGPYEAEEGCLSLAGQHTATRYKKIKVTYQNARMQPKSRTFHGFTAQIIQHEIDHCNGILI